MDIYRSISWLGLEPLTDLSASLTPAERDALAERYRYKQTPQSRQIADRTL